MEFVPFREAEEIPHFVGVVAYFKTVVPRLLRLIRSRLYRDK